MIAFHSAEKKQSWNEERGQHNQLFEHLDYVSRQSRRIDAIEERQPQTEVTGQQDEQHEPRLISGHLKQLWDTTRLRAARASLVARTANSTLPPAIAKRGRCELPSAHGSIVTNVGFIAVSQVERLRRFHGKRASE